MRKPKETPRNILDTLIPGHEALMPEEKKLGLRFLRWFQECARDPLLREMCEFAAQARGDRLACMKTLKELSRLKEDGENIVSTLAQLARLDRNTFLIITAKLKNIARLKEEATESRAGKIRVETSEKVKDVLG